MITTFQIHDLSQAPSIVDLFDDYRTFYKQKSDKENARIFLDKRLTNNESIIIVASIDDVIVGFTQLYPSFSSVSMKRLYILNDLFVKDEARGKGVGQALLQAAETLGRKNGWKGMTLETANDNPAQNLYKREGWSIDNEYLHFGKYF